MSSKNGPGKVSDNKGDICLYYLSFFSLRQTVLNNYGSNSQFNLF